MAKAHLSQWEFGELFPVEAVRKALTVSEVTGSIRRLLEKEVGRVCVLGEMTNLRAQPSGHVYFTLKDASAQLACVMFRAEAQSVNRSILQDGQRVAVDGEITVYEARGQYQLRAVSIQQQGLGALQAAFERLKQKLQAEGLFDQAHKRPLPRCPQAIGLITSPQGAAISDVLRAVERRNPALRVVLAPCRVQGSGAAAEIAAAIHLLNDWARGGGEKLEAILLTRGGGSIEDLWAFNEEIVARAIYASELPVVSAVGHEIDFTMSDFVADVRAATPTAGAEMITEGVFAARPFLAEAPQRLFALAEQAIQRRSEIFRQQWRRLARLHPKRRLQDETLRIDGLQHSLNRSARHRLIHLETRWNGIAQRLARARPGLLLRARQESFQAALQNFQRSIVKALDTRREGLARLRTRLELLSPKQVLKRGYSITLHERTGKVLRHPGEAQPGDRLKSVLEGGAVISQVPPIPAT